MLSLEAGKKLPLHVIRDNAKWVFLPTKVILSACICWPENDSKFLIWLRYFCIFVYTFFLYGNVYFMTHANSDITSIVLAVTFFIVMIEALARYEILINKREKLNNLLNIVYHEFWPSDAVGKRVHAELLIDSRRIIFILSFYTIAAFICGMQFITNAVFFKYLPLMTTYPFDWSKSPYYELMLCFQSFFTMNTPIIVCAGDWLLVSILLVCVAQFKLLKTYVKEDIKTAILMDQKFKTQNAKKMLEFALNHHKKLIKVCESINDIFQYYILLQFLTSAVTVCVSTFVMTFMPQQRLSGVTYFLGHVFEIFIYCYMGSELLFESADLSDHIFHCGWHLTNTENDFRKSLILGIMRSQHPIKIKAGGFGQLQLSTFLNLIKFSFSVFTLLRSLMGEEGGSI